MQLRSGRTPGFTGWSTWPEPLLAMSLEQLPPQQVGVVYCTSSSWRCAAELEARRRVLQLQPGMALMLRSGDRRQLLLLLHRLLLPKELERDSWPKRLVTAPFSAKALAVRFVRGERSIHETTVELDTAEVRNTQQYVKSMLGHGQCEAPTLVIRTQWVIEASDVPLTRMVIDVISVDGRCIELLNAPLQVDYHKLKTSLRESDPDCELPAPSLSCITSGCIASKVAHYDWERLNGAHNHGKICLESNIKCSDPSATLINHLRHKILREENVKSEAVARRTKIETRRPAIPVGHFITARELVRVETEQADIRRQISVSQEAMCSALKRLEQQCTISKQNDNWKIQEITLNLSHYGNDTMEPLSIQDLRACLESAVRVPKPLSWSEFIFVYEVAFGVAAGEDESAGSRLTGELVFQDSQLVMAEGGDTHTNFMNGLSCVFPTPEGDWERFEDYRDHGALSVAIHVVRCRDGASGTIYTHDYGTAFDLFQSANDEESVLQIEECDPYGSAGTYPISMGHSFPHSMFAFPYGDGMHSAYGFQGIDLVSNISLRFKVVDRKLKFGQIDQASKVFTPHDYDTFEYPESEDDHLYMDWKCRDKYGLHALSCQLNVLRVRGQFGDDEIVPMSFSNLDHLRLFNDICL